MRRFDLHGKVALVSGCSQGLGYACVLTLARHGADIFGVSIGDDSNLKKEVEEYGVKYHSIVLSLTTPGAMDKIMKEVLVAYEHIDILLNFAGVVKKEETMHVNDDLWDSVMNVNVKASFFLSQAVIAQFLKQGHGGKIINASGILPKQYDDYTLYSISKGSIDAMTKTMAAQFAKDDIQINAIRFGFMTTGTSLQTDESGHYDHKMLEEIPAKRWGCYKDVDGLLLLLASSASNYMNGCIISIDGGYSIS